MKRRLTILTAAVLTAAVVQAETYTLNYTPDTTTATLGQLRLEGGVSRRLGDHWHLELSEELRLGTGGLDRAYTNLGLDYRINKRLKAGVDYSFVLINGSKKWKTRHRVGLNLAGNVKAGRWKLTLREKPFVSLRTGSVNTVEKNRADLHLRSKLTAEYNVRHRPLRPYASIELGNTLNAKQASGTYGGNTYTWDGNYVDKIRPTVGLKYKAARCHEWNFYYKFDYDYNRDIDVKKSSGKLYLTHERELTHVVGVAYNFNWK